jgi:AraC family cel operon transcriptional repressor
MSKTDSRITQIVGPAQVVRLVRAPLAKRKPRTLSRHACAVLLWVQNAQLRLHLDGATLDLAEGDLVFLRPGEAHALQGRGEEPLVVAVAIWEGLIAALAERHDNLPGALFWSDAARPTVVRLDPRALAELNRSALRLERVAASPLEAEAFLLPVIAEVLARQVTLPDGAPDWLAEVLAAAKDPRVFRDGAAGLARAAGRSHPHVSRTVRRFTGLSPSDYINAQRMAFAARRLSGSSDTLAEIAADCGVPNLSHFHKLFRAAHGVTPAEFRRRFQNGLLQTGR